VVLRWLWSAADGVILISETNEPRTIRVASYRKGVVYSFRPTKNILNEKVNPSSLLCSEYCENKTNLHLDTKHPRLYLVQTLSVVVGPLDL